MTMAKLGEKDLEKWMDGLAVELATAREEGRANVRHIGEWSEDSGPWVIGYEDLLEAAWEAVVFLAEDKGVKMPAECGADMAEVMASVLTERLQGRMGHEVAS